MDKKIVFSY